MDGFTYQNIFDTKGIEYLAIIAFFAILIPFWVILNRQVKISKEIQRTLGTITASVLRIPQGVFFSQNHTWTHLDKAGVARVGVDDFLLHLTGEVNLRKMKQPGEIIQKGEFLADFEHKGKSLKIDSPISGEIVEYNRSLLEDPKLLNEDPYLRGWIYKIKPSRWIAETNSYYLAEEATNWSAREIERFKDFLASSVERYTEDPSNLVLQDGGELIDQPLSELPTEVWQDFEHRFLGTKPKYPHFRSLGKQEYGPEYK
jgi:glycine cleavage system H protein